MRETLHMDIFLENYKKHAKLRKFLQKIQMKTENLYLQRL